VIVTRGAKKGFLKEAFFCATERSLLLKNELMTLTIHWFQYENCLKLNTEKRYQLTF